SYTPVPKTGPTAYSLRLSAHIPYKRLFLTSSAPAYIQKTRFHQSVRCPEPAAPYRCARPQESAHRLRSFPFLLPPYQQIWYSTRPPGSDKWQPVPLSSGNCP